MFYTIYKITNKINNKFYIGKHQTSNLNDGYMGSGKLIVRAIKKYRIDNFVKEILHVFDTEEEMNLKEKDLVIVGESSYNLCDGGQGGFGYINQNGLSVGHKFANTSEAKAKKSITVTRYQQNLSNEEKFEISEKIKQAHKKINYNHASFKGKKHSEETLTKMRNSKKGSIPWNKGLTKETNPSLMIVSLKNRRVVP